MFNSVLFVCIGNVCRSPVGEGLLKKYATEHGLDIKVGSAGVHALVGEPPQPYSQEVSLEHGLDISSYMAEQITQEMVYEHELIIVLDSMVREILLKKYPFAAGKISKLGRFDNNMDIVDPYKKAKQAFANMYDNMDKCVKNWLKAVWQVSI